MTLEEVVNKKYKERHEHLLGILVGGVKSYEEYRFILGQLRGMYELMALIEPYLAQEEE